MIHQDDISKARKERIEMHRRNLEDGSLRVDKTENEHTSPIMFQTIICLFIFAFILLIKLTDIGITNDLAVVLSSTLEKDNLPKIINFIESSESSFAFSPYNTEQDNYSELDNSKDSNTKEQVNVENIEADTIQTDVENNEVNDPQTTDNTFDSENDSSSVQELPATEFTIDENMLSEIGEDTSFLEQK